MEKIEKPMLLVKTCSHIVKKSQAHLDSVLKKYELSSGSYPFLLALSEEEGVSLEKLSKKLSVDKAMSTRTIQKLTALGYLTKLPDAFDSRAFRLYLTEKARGAIPGIREEIDRWTRCITEGLSEEEKQTAMRLLQKIAEKTQY